MMRLSVKVPDGKHCGLCRLLGQRKDEIACCQYWDSTITHDGYDFVKCSLCTMASKVIADMNKRGDRA